MVSLISQSLVFVYPHLVTSIIHVNLASTQIEALNGLTARIHASTPHVALSSTYNKRSFDLRYCKSETNQTIQIRQPIKG